MYATCLFCHAALGRNEAIEHFPVGRRLAFDSEKGRLWVVCARCARWNLTPLEERWEAVEECERRFRQTRLRVSTDNVGLARLRDGVDLVRIGRPLRPEFAAWRYGDQFGRRRREAMMRGATAAALGGVVLAGPAIGLMTGGVVIAVNIGAQVLALRHARRSIVHLPHPEGGYIALGQGQVPSVRLVEGAGPGAWGLEVPYFAVGPEPTTTWWEMARSSSHDVGRVRLTGDDAVRAAGRLLSRINARGAPAGQVRDAVRMIDEAGSADRFFAAAAASVRRWSAEQRWGDTGALQFLPTPARLALEMAANEEAERAALEGEVAALEQEWKEAEQIAAVADDLLLPRGVREWLRGTERRGTEGRTP